MVMCVASHYVRTYIYHFRTAEADDYIVLYVYTYIAMYEGPATMENCHKIYKSLDLLRFIEIYKI